MNNLANVEENDENTLGHAADLSRLLRSWKCWAHPLRRLLVGIRVVPVGPSLVPSDVPPRREGVVIQGTLMEILTDFGTEFLLIGEGGGGGARTLQQCGACSNQTLGLPVLFRMTYQRWQQCR